MFIELKRNNDVELVNLANVYRVLPFDDNTTMICLTDGKSYLYDNTYVAVRQQIRNAAI